MRERPAPRSWLPRDAATRMPRVPGAEVHARLLLPALGARLLEAEPGLGAVRDVLPERHA